MDDRPRFPAGVQRAAGLAGPDATVRAIRERLDLYLLFGERIADHFLAAYQAASGSVWPDALLWDLWAAARSHETVQTWVPNYRGLGRADLTARELRRRHTAWTDYLLERRGRPGQTVAWRATGR